MKSLFLLAFHFHGVHVAEPPGQLAASFAAVAHEIVQIAGCQGEVPFPGADGHGLEIRQQDQVFQPVFSALDVLGGNMDNLVAFSFGQFGKLLKGKNKHAPLQGNRSQIKAIRVFP